MTTKQLAALLVIALLLVGYLEYRNEPTEKAIREEWRSVYLRPCDATISDGQHYNKMPDPRCYFFRSAK